MNRNTDEVEITNLYKKMGLSDCNQGSNSYGYLNEEEEDAKSTYLQQQLKDIKNKTLKTIKSSGSGEIQENWPATSTQIMKMNEEAPTLFCGKSKVLSNGKVLMSKGDCNMLNVWMPVNELIDNYAAVELLNSLGINSKATANLGADKYIEFKCEVNAVNLISGNDMEYETAN